MQTVPRRVNGELCRVNDKGRRVNGEHRRVNGEHRRVNGEHRRVSGEHRRVSGEHRRVNACDGRTIASTSRTPRQRSQMVAERRVVPPTPTPARRSRRRESPCLVVRHVNGEECPFALLRREAGENFATRASLLIYCRRTAFGFRAIFAGCKSLIEELYHAEPGHNDSFLLAAEPTGRRSSAIRGRSLLDDLGNVVCRGSLPSRSRRACFLVRRCPSPGGLNSRHRRAAAVDRGVFGAGP